MTNIEIYNALIAAGMTPEGACGTIANMASEGVMRSDNAQDSYGIDDKTYTEQTDNGLNNFANDDIGYGLCQWTEKSRKAKLLAYAKNLGVSIGDRKMQVDFCILEMQTDFPAVWQVVTTSHDLLQCTQIVLNVYENPAIKNLGTRMEYANQAYAYFTSQPPAPLEEEELAPDACPVGGSCGSTDISVECGLLAAYLQTEEFQKKFLAFVARWEEK